MVMPPTLPWIVYSLLSVDRPGFSVPADQVLAMWREIEANDDRILYTLRNLLPLGGPIPGHDAEVQQAGFQKPITLIADIDGKSYRLDEGRILEVVRGLLAGSSPPEAPKKSPGRAQLSLF